MQNKILAIVLRDYFWIKTIRHYTHTVLIYTNE